MCQNFHVLSMHYKVIMSAYFMSGKFRHTIEVLINYHVIFFGYKLLDVFRHDSNINFQTSYAHQGLLISVSNGGTVSYCLQYV